MREPRYGARAAVLAMLTLVIAGLGQGTSAAIPDLDQVGDPLVCDQRGRTDPGWGFSIVIPAALAGCQYEFHDLLIPLGARSEDRVITSTGHYNATCIKSVKELGDDLTDLSGENDVASHARLVSRSPTTLGGQKAVRVVIAYRDITTKVDMMRDRIVSMSAKRDAACHAPAYNYWLTLETPASHYRRDRGIFEEMIRTCRPTAIGTEVGILPSGERVLVCPT